MSRLIKQYQKITSVTSKGLNWVSMGFLAILTLFTLVDVLGRSLFNSPLTGGYELTELMLTVMVAFGLGNSGLVYKPKFRNAIVVKGIRRSSVF